MLFKRNNFFIGLISAVVLTACVYGIMHLVVEYILLPQFGARLISEKVMMMTGLSANVLLASAFLNKRSNNSAAGVMAFFMLCAAYIVFRFFSE